MADADTAAAQMTKQAAAPKRRRWWRKIAWLPYTAMVLLGGFVLVVFIGPLVMTYDPIQTDVANAFVPPIGSGGTWSHPLGTDNLGRDILARMIVAGRLSVIVVVLSVILGVLIGTVAGLLAGYFGGIVDTIISRLVDAQMALPFIIIALVIAIAAGPQTTGEIAVVALSLWAGVARIIRAETLALRESEFVSLAEIAGLRRVKIIWRHLVPNLVPSVIVLVTLDVGRALIYSSSLSFLGLGTQPPNASLGLMIAQGQPYLLTAAWVLLIPAGVLACLTLSAIIIGDWLQQKLDPTQSVAE